MAIRTTHALRAIAARVVFLTHIRSLTEARRHGGAEGATQSDAPREVKRREEKRKEEERGDRDEARSEGAKQETCDKHFAA